jgi:hypothetical protein
MAMQCILKKAKKMYNKNYWATPLATGYFHINGIRRLKIFFFGFCIANLSK